MLQNNAQNLSLNTLLKSPAAKELKELISFMGTAVSAFSKMRDNGESEYSAAAKEGTAILLMLLGKLARGTAVGDLTKADWREILESASDITVSMDGQAYSRMVFMLYAEYIDASVRAFSDLLSPENQEAICALAEELRFWTKRLETGGVSETEYTEQCLWISLEGMIKLLSSLRIFAIAEEYEQLIQAVSAFAFEFGRLRLYRREQELLKEYIAHQYQLDETLKAQFEEYRQDLERENADFNALMEKAFEPDFRKQLMNTAALARAAGVAEEEILHSEEEVDAFFSD